MDGEGNHGLKKTRLRDEAGGANLRLMASTASMQVPVRAPVLPRTPSLVRGFGVLIWAAAATVLVGTGLTLLRAWGSLSLPPHPAPAPAATTPAVAHAVVAEAPAALASLDQPMARRLVMDWQVRSTGESI